MRLTSFAFLIFLLSACNNSNPAPAAANVDLTGFTQRQFDGITEAVKKADDGTITELGYLTNGSKNGVWTTYHPNENRIKTMTTFVNGIKNGLHFEFSKRGQIEKKVTYINDQYHGQFATYKNGRPVTEMTYDNGQLTGVFNEYDSRGKLQKSTEYKDGKPHGKMTFYNEEAVVLEYVYKNGEKVSGGMTNDAAESK